MIEKYSARRQLSLAIPVLATRILLVAAAVSTMGATFALSSCARKKPAERAATTSTPGATAAPASPLPQRTNGDVPRPGPKTVPPLAAAVRAFGLGEPSTPRVARDFSLGPLQSYEPAEGEEAAVFAVAHKFMDGVASGKLDRELLIPEAREALSLLLEPIVSRSATAPGARGGSTGYRLGAIALRGEDASLKVRLPVAANAEDASKASRTEGLLSLRKSGGAWYVEALALSPPESAVLAFVPDAPGQTK